MKQRIQSALDESLSSVHFDARDMHRVLRAVREQEEPARKPRKCKALRLDFVFAVATAALVIVPLSLFALRAQHTATSNIATIAAHGAQAPTEMPTGHEDVILATPAPAQDRSFCDEHAAIEAARACFEARCDTTVFTFDEYAVDVSSVTGEDGMPSSYVVTMVSIYGNGCSFLVTVCAADGSVIAHSSPQLATVPAALDRECAEVQAWYGRYGEHSFTWPLGIQAEFSRRYEGGMRRMPKESDVGTDAILIAAQRYLSQSDDASTFYLSLYAERAFDDGIARYRVYCFDSDAPSESCTVLTLRASDGVLESYQILPTSDL